MYDVCIIGAGPAGSTLARLLPAGLRVLLVDRRRLDRPYVRGTAAKPCGGLLAPSAQRELATQGLGVPSRVIAGPQLFAVRAVDLDARIEQHYQRYYLNVDRESLDRWLVSMIPDSVSRLFGYSAYAIDRDHGSPLVRLRASCGAPASVAARLVVGADGAASIVAATLGARRSAARYVAVQGVFEGGSDDASFGAYFDRENTDFYGWSIPKGRYLSIGVACPRGAGAASRFDAFVRRLAESGQHVGTQLGRESAPLLRPSHPGELRLGGEGLLLVGEAAGLISASSAEGISYALRSGRALAEALAGGLDGAAARYRIAAGPTVADALGKMVKSRVIYEGRARRALMRSGVTAIRPTREDRRVAGVGTC